MKKLLFIDHKYHNKTKSSQFMQDLLKAKYEVTKFNFDPYSDSFGIFNSLKGEVFDVVVLWQIMPSVNRLRELISFKHIAFFPMYDNVPSLIDPIWYQYADCNIINFSKTLHSELKKRGLSSYYIQYFPKPKEIKTLGDEKSVFLWQRITQVNPETVDEVIGFENIDKFHHHQAIDPLHRVVEVAEKYSDKAEISTWFDTKEEMESHLQKSAIYFAPRELEGIGMSFLDAMALGRCVIAPDNSTMNEYIEDKKNGYLYNLKKPKRIELGNIREIQENTVEFIKNGYNQWEENKHQILEWVERDVAENRDDELMKKALVCYEVQKKKIKLSITYLKKKITNTDETYYLFGFLPIYKRKKR